MRVILRVTDSGPISLRSNRDASGAESIDYVPGRVVLGGLARAHTVLRNNIAEFNEFFLSPHSSFGNLYPASFRPDLIDLQGDTDPVYPLPATAVTCKRFGGFTFDEYDAQDDPHHGVYDTLISWALFSLGGQIQPGFLAGLSRCNHSSGCQEQLDRFDGYYRRNSWDNRKMGCPQVDRGIRTRTGISRQTGAVAKSILYSREVLGPGMSFWGTATIPDSSVDTFYRFVEEANDAGELRFGSNRTRGLGRAVLSMDTPGSVDTTQDLKARVLSFNQEFQQQAAIAGVMLPHTLYVPVTLASDVILLDHLLRYQTYISADYLQESWQLSDAVLVYHSCSVQPVMAWNDTLHLPRADETAVAKGSVFLFGFSSSLDDSKIGTFLRMQEQGLGVRLREGFGRIVIANSFHWEVKGQ